MATITAVIVPAKALKGGRHKIRISVSHNGDVRYILTDIIIDSTTQFKNGQVVKRPDANYLNVKLRSIVQHWQEALDRVPCTSGLTASELVSAMQNETMATRRSLGSVFDEYQDIVVNTDSSREVYKTRFATITKSIPKTTLMENITHASVLMLMKQMRSDGLSQTTMRYRLAFLKTLMLYAEKCGYVSYRVSPFAGVQLPKEEVRDAWLTIEEIKTIRDAELTWKSQRKARDLFMLSYYLGGINAADMLKINFNECNGTVSYVRQKVKRFNNTVTIPIMQEAQDVIDRIIGSDGYIAVTDRERSDACNGLFHRAMPSIGKATGIGKLIFYSARKSFAQHAYEAGVSTPTIDYILGHGTGKAGTSSLFNYITVSQVLVEEAMRKVLDNLK